MSRIATTVERVRGTVAGGRRGPFRTAGAWLAVAGVAGVTGAIAAINASVGLAVAALVLLLGVFVADPVVLAVIALPGAILVQRVGGGGTNISMADVLVFLGGITSLFWVNWRSAPHLRRFLAGVVWYEAIMILVVAVHPFKGDIIEWLHRFSYLGLSTLCGWVAAHFGRARQAFRLYLWGAGLLAVLAIEHAVTLHFQPAQWGVYQKNAIGDVMWVAIVIAQLNPRWMAIPRREAQVVKVLCLLGLLASQSRQAAVLLVLALGLALLLNPAVRRRARLMVLAAVPIVVLIYYSFAVAAHNNPKFNSVAIRLDQITAAMHVWYLSPVFGEGLRFYNLPQFVTVTAPPNVLVDNLASGGVVGSFAFVLLVVLTLLALFRLPRAYGILGFVILFAFYTGGLFDTFWIGAHAIAPFVIAGLCLGLADADPGAERAVEARVPVKVHRSVTTRLG